MVNSNQKGKRGEREVAKLFRDHGFEAERSQQYCGNVDAPDIKQSIPNIHPEVKFVEKLSIYKAMQQAKDECGDKIPCVFHRKSREDWCVTLKASDFLKIAKDIGVLYDQD